jgi:predicted DCC family thiol-disulfide oxidoreductase YuxK
MYDGFCGLCSIIIRFILKRDPEGIFRFATIQNEFSRNHIRAHGKDPDKLDTFYVLVDPGGDSEKLLSHAHASMYVLSRLDGFQAWLSCLGLLPDFILDAGYRLIAKNRYRIFGRNDSCMLSKPEWEERFIAVD